MKMLIFKHYLKRSLTEPVGIGIVTGLPTALIVILSLVMMGQVPEGMPYMWNGYNVVATHIAIMFMISFQFFGGSVLLDYLHTDFRGDRRWRMFSMPVKTNDFVFASLGACFIYCLVQGGLVIGITAIFLDVHWGNPLVLVVTLAACSMLSQLVWMLLFLIFPKKGTVEAAGQIITWAMMIASGWIGMSIDDGDVIVAGGAAFNNFITRFGTPISLARNAITNSGFIGDDMNNALISLGALYAVLIIIAAAVIIVGKKKGFSPAKSAVAASAVSTPDKKLAGAKETQKIHDTVDISKQRDLQLVTPSTKRGGKFTIYKFALLRACRNSLSLALNAVLPLVIIFIPGLWRGSEAMGFSLIGVALMYGSFVAARGILNDKLDGTLTRIFTAPVTALKYLSQNLLAAMTPLTLQILIVGIAGSILYEGEINFALF
jgi:hypothetical protein